MTQDSLRRSGRIAGLPIISTHFATRLQCVFCKPMKVSTLYATHCLFKSVFQAGGAASRLYALCFFVFSHCAIVHLDLDSTSWSWVALDRKPEQTIDGDITSPVRHTLTPAVKAPSTMYAYTICLITKRGLMQKANEDAVYLILREAMSRMSEATNECWKECMRESQDD